MLSRNGNVSHQVVTIIFFQQSFCFWNRSLWPFLFFGQCPYIWFSYRIQIKSEYIYSSLKTFFVTWFTVLGQSPGLGHNTCSKRIAEGHAMCQVQREQREQGVGTYPWDFGSSHLYLHFCCFVWRNNLLLLEPARKFSFPVNMSCCSWTRFCNLQMLEC